MKNVKKFGRKVLSLLLVVFMLMTTLCFFDMSTLKVKAADTISVWDGKSETPNTDNLNSAYPNDLFKTTENDVNVLHIKTARGLMLYANVVANKGWFHEWYVKLDVDVNLGAASWMGIGNGNDKVFTGTFDGQGHKIYNMHVDSTGDNLGFIRKANGATVKNVTFERCTVSTDGMAGYSHGTVIGWCDGNAITLDNVTAVSSKVYGDCYIGGLVGSGDADITFKNCRNLYSADYANRVCNGKDYFVKGNDGLDGNGGVGGFVGRMGENRKLTIDYGVNSAYVSITQGSRNNFRIGGFAGRARGEVYISHSYNYGVIGDSNDRKGLTAGFIGNAERYVKISNSQNLGSIYGSDRTAGFIGWHDGDYNIDIDYCSNYGAISGTAEQAGGIIALSNSNKTITINNTKNYGNVSTNRHAAGIVGITYGSLFCNKVDNEGVISTTSDIYAAGICTYIDDDDFSFTDCNNFGEIICGTNGNFYTNAAGILAVYHGACQGDRTYTFTRCTNTGKISAASGTAGIFGYLADSGKKFPTIKFIDCSNTGAISCYTSDGDVGGIAGNIDSDNQVYFTNCKNTGNITSNNAYVGGIAGKLKGYVTATDCINEGNVKGNTRVGGIFGRIEDDDCVFTRCKNFGDISATWERIGGIVGSFDGDSNMKFKNCENRGDILGAGNSVAGLVGHTSGSLTVEDCVNTGVVTMSADYEYTAGLIGWVDDDDCTFTNSVNYGTVKGRRRVGGFVGGMNGGTLTFTNCGNLGDINVVSTTNSTYGGGFVAWFNGNTVNFNQCYNGNGVKGYIGTSDVRFSRAGGFIGWTTTATFNDCYNNANVYSKIENDSYVGGFVGEAGNTNCSVKNSYFAGMFSGYSQDGRAGTFIGRNSAATVDRAYYLAAAETFYPANTSVQGTELSSEVMKSAEMISNNLNDGKWSVDSNGINQGYPVIKVAVTYTQRITFKNFNGAVLEVRDWAYASVPKYMGTAPTRPSDVNYHYIFNNEWSPEITAVTGEATYVAQFDAVEHDGNKVSVNDSVHRNVCSVCGYVNTNSNTPHNKTWKSDATSHWSVCADCNYVSAKADHDFAYKSEGNVHWQECTVCGYQATRTYHTYSEGYDENGHWQHCDLCDYNSESIAHSLYYRSTADGHVQYCSACSYVTDSHEHKFEFKTSLQQHWQYCTECGFSGTKSVHSNETQFDANGHWQYCDVCGYTFDVEFHAMKYISDGDTHYRKCQECDYKTEALPHDYEYRYNDISHWQVCPTCGETSTVTERHVFGDDDVCDICGYVDTGLIREVNITVDYRDWTAYSSSGYTRAAATQLASIIDVAESSYTISPENVHLYLYLTNGYSYDVNTLSDRLVTDESITGFYMRLDAKTLTGKTFAPTADIIVNVKVIDCDGTEKMMATSLYRNRLGDSMQITVNGDSVTKMIPAPHTHVCQNPTAGLAPTENEDGWKDYYECDLCAGIFEDAELKSEIADLEAWKADGGKLPATGHEYTEWQITVYPTTEADGLSERECIHCHDKQTRTIAKTLSNCGIDGTTIYGLSSATTVESFIEQNTLDTGVQVEVNPARGNFIGTGTTVTFTYSTGEVIEYTVVIFGDVNGDGWYDGTDATVVKMIVGGMLSQTDVSEAVWTASDCNHDGTIDEYDAELLEQAGLILADVNQSKTKEELSTNSAFAEYQNLISQNPDEYEPTPMPDYQLSIIEKIAAFILGIWKFIMSVFGI